MAAIIFEQLGMPRQAEELIKKEYWNVYITITGQTINMPAN